MAQAEPFEKELYQHRKDDREIVVVKLIKRKTEDGLLEFYEDVPIGNKYVVYKEPVLVEGLHKPTCTYWQREMYEAVDGGWLPTELLEIVK